jgi:uncharacterized protein (TIGR03084 family)
MNADVIADLLQECRELADRCRDLSDDEWHRAGPFHGWTPWDTVAHLCYFDEASLVALADASRFEREAAVLSARTASGEAISRIARAHFGPIDGTGLLDRWQERYTRLSEGLAARDPRSRLPWYGPSMSVRSFATARLMETWAHGQDVWDTFGQARQPTPRMRHIAHLGFTTFRWTFVNRDLPVPEPTPRLALRAPDGGTWTWGDDASPESVSGSALGFCLVVTQRRHVADTDLRCTPGSAAQWMAIAQCFAGEPADGPAPGVRRIAAY